MTTYNKLVRDKIPDIIREDGKACETRILSDQEFLVELKRKLVEEATELLDATSKEKVIEELADVYEVLHFILKSEHILKPTLDNQRVKKNHNRGSFGKKILLLSVDD